MRSFIRLTDFSKQELLEIFKIADSMEQYEGNYVGESDRMVTEAVVVSFKEDKNET